MKHQPALILGASIAAVALCAAEKPHPGTATSPAPVFKAGDAVKAKWGRDWVPAKVTQITPTGWYTVSLVVNRSPMTPTLPPAKVIAADAPEPREPGTPSIETPDMREWTTEAGEKLPRARVHQWDGKMKKVLLQKENGVCVRIDVPTLSAADRDYLSKLPRVHAD